MTRLPVQSAWAIPAARRFDAAAKKGNPDAVKFPRVFLEEDSYDFSFSGLKSAVLNYVNKQKMMGEEIVPEDIAASFQQSVVEVLVSKTIKAARAHGVKKIALAGGVASNSALRKKMQEACEKNGFVLSVPAPILCTDNAAMIGCAAYYEYIAGVRDGLDLNANPSLKLGQR